MSNQNLRIKQGNLTDEEFRILKNADEKVKVRRAVLETPDAVERALSPLGALVVCVTALVVWAIARCFG